MLTGKNAVVTGANRGIGRAIVQKFAEHGANIWACARKIDSRFEHDMEMLAGQYGVWIKPVSFDLEHEESVREGTKLITAEKLPVDVIVNNAGVTSVSLLMQTNISEIRRMFEVNYFSQLYLIQRLQKTMIRRKTGSIINIVSIRGMDPEAGRLAYSSSKAAMISATGVLSKELGSYGIRVNAIAPGHIETEMLNGNIDDEMRSRLLSQIALKRIGSPEEIANTALFLASDQSSYITGQTIRVDGGK